MFISKTNSSDYDDEMNGTHFAEWFEKKLVTNLPPRSVIVLDNAPYHNVVVEKVPVQSSTKTFMREWLTKHEIRWKHGDLKRDLFEKIKETSPQKEYVVDGIAKAAGHSVLRSPIAHCELNPIELVWASVKKLLEEA